MANLSAALNSLASSSVMDFYKPFFHHEGTEDHYLKMSRIMTLAWGAALVAIALAAGLAKESVLELALTIASVPYGAMLGIFLLGVLTRRATGQGAFIGALAGIATVVAVVAAPAFHFTGIAWTWYVAIGTTVTFTVGWAASQMIPVSKGAS
jgi:solute:Na+ symporter, SSS family